MPHRVIIVEWLYKADQDFGFAKLGLEDKEVGYYDPKCMENDESLGELMGDCRFLTPFYYELRYADQKFVTAGREDAVRAKEAAQRIRNKIKEKLRIEGEITREVMEKEEGLADEGK